MAPLASPPLVKQRIELKSCFSNAQSERIIDAVGSVARAITHTREPFSTVLSVYYENEAMRADGNGSIRLRTYEPEALHSVGMLPAVLDAKLEASTGPQSKWRISYDQWDVAHQDLMLRPNELFPQLSEYYRGLATLSADYGIRYRRYYYEIGAQCRITVDTNLRPLRRIGQGRLIETNVHEYGVIELKCDGIEALEAQRSLWSELTLLLPAKVSSKRTIARRANNVAFRK